MNDKSELEKIVNIITLVGTLLSLVGGGITFIDTKNPIQSLKTTGLILVIIFILWFAFKVVEKLVQRWIGRTAENMDTWLQSVFSRFPKKYNQHLIFRHRDFDVKGLSTQGVFTLELERIFVELTVSPQAYHRVSTNILSTTPDELPKGSHVVWDYLKSKGQSGTRLVILGAPGSGKTTLLKNITLVLASGRKPKQNNRMGNKLPILLFLRDYTEAITDRPAVLLPEIIQMSLEKYQILPPPKWFEKHLQTGACVVMLDGLDEVADPDIRKKVVAWVDKQMVSYPNNHFIITSRPFGYRENQLNGVSVLEVLPFNIRQVKQFIDNWYLANEIQSYQKDDEGVRIKAREGADDLFTRLRKTPILLDLAVNPLLLTMIATVHRYRSSLPGRRVELYKEICEVFLGKRQGARGIELPLTPAQKQSVLQPLAYHMMRNHIREIDKRSALLVFAERLNLVSPQNTVEEFLQMIENSSGLLLERENGIYGFAHKTFQEYLASVHVIEQGLEKELVSNFEDVWWHECIRLYSAQADATSVIEACISADPPSASALTLAIACEDEAREVHPNTRRKLEDVLLEGVESKNYETRKIVAEALLTLNIRDMTRIDDNIYIGRRFVNHAEYQLFLDEMNNQKKPSQPDHWQGKEFSNGKGLEPIVGVRAVDGIEFCAWLTQRENGEWRFRFPAQNEISLSKSDIQKDLNYWVVSDPRQTRPVLMLQNFNYDITPKVVDMILVEDMKIAEHMDKLLGLDITRSLISAGPMLNQILAYVNRASYHDLGVSGVTYNDTDWAKLVDLARQFSGLIKDASLRMNSFGARMISANASELSMDLARQISAARDDLRAAYLPGAYPSNRADRSAKAAAAIKATAQNLAKYGKHLDADVIGAKNLNAGEMKKIGQGTGLNIIDLTNFAVTIETTKLLSIMAVFKQQMKKYDFMNIFNMDLSEYPQLEKAFSHILTRDSRISLSSSDVKKLTSCYLRLLLIFAVGKIGSEKKLPAFLERESSDHRPKEADLVVVVEKIKTMYMALVVLEARKLNAIRATESIRVVRERVNVEV